MRRPSSYVIGVFSIAASIGTGAAALLGIPRVWGFPMAAVAVALAVWAIWLHVQEGRAPRVADHWEELKARLAEVNGVRTWLNLREDPDERLPLDEDQVFQWAKKTFQLIDSKFPEHADAFMGESDAALGSPYFAVAYAPRRDQMGRDGYLESRAKMVGKILRERPQK